MANLSVKKQLMLADYKSCLEILRHEDGRKAQLFSAFSILQGVLFGAYGTITDNGKSAGAVTIAAVALFLSLIWFFVMERMKRFVELRYIQGRRLEEELKDLWTIRLELSLRENGKVDVYGEEMKLKYHQRRFSISKHLESLLPIFTGLIWILLVGSRFLPTP